MTYYMDWDLTWNTNNPDFTSCFEDTVLAWGPCTWLWVFAAFDVYYCLNSRKSIPWSPLSVAKCGVMIVLIILQLFLLGIGISSETGYIVDLLTPTIRILTFGLALFLIILCKKRGIRSSGIQFLFWTLLVFCEAFGFRSAIIKSFQDDREMYVFIIKMVFYPGIIAQLFLHCWADVPPQYEESPRPQVVERPCPEEGASFLSRIIFFWFETLAWKGYRKSLEYTDLWDLNPEDKSSSLVPIFEKNWLKSVKLAKFIPEQKATFRQRTGSVDFKEPSRPQGVSGGKPEASILPTLIKVFGPTFFFGSLLKLIQDLLTFVSPQILKLLIAFVADKNNGKGDEWKGYFFAGLLLVTSVIQTLVLGQYFHRMFLVGMRMRSTLVSCIYRKALRISNSARKESTVGEIVNLMSVDAQRLMDLTTYLNMVWSAPLQISLSLYFLWDTLGPSVLAGLAVMILLIPINAVIASKVKTLQIKQMKSKDVRVKKMNEVLSGIKVLKLYAWEPSFEAEIMKVREKEIKVLKDAAYLNAISAFIWTCAPFLVAVVTFGTYVLIDPANILNAEKAFVALTLFNIMRMPMSMGPMILISIVNSSVSLKRLNHYLNAEEIDPNAVTHSTEEADPIVVDRGTFSWEKGNPVLKDINCRVKEGSLTCIVGVVGSGKSSLLSALLGEMETDTGRVNMKGRVAYMQQQAWIQNCSLRDNILFGLPFEPVKYDRIINCTALQPDLDILPAGDNTEIGEKGINLSGGQKQRVSLARAVYNNADIYLCDDPLSAVDAHVGLHLFDNVLGPKGLLKKKTRVLVTHGVTFLPQMDNIIVMKDGQISESGSYKELLDKKGDFAEFLIQYLGSEKDDNEDESIIIQDLEERLDRRILPRKRSKVSESSDSPSKAFGRQMSVTSQESGERESPRRKMSKTFETDLSTKEKLLGQDGKEKLIEVEKSETGSVKLSVYQHYFKAVGWGMTFWVVLLHFSFQAFSVGSNIWLSKWSTSNEGKNVSSQDTNERDLYLGVYAGLGVGQALSVLAAAIVMALGTLQAASILHYGMLERVLKSPMQFFDSTPIGRILNRFAKDVDVCDNVLGMNIRSYLNCLFTVLSTLSVISYSTPIFLAVVLPTGILYYLIQRFYVATSRQLKRLESVSRSPIYSHFSETLTGAPTIRAYHDQSYRFIQESEFKVDHNQIAYYPSIVSNRWLAVRLETIGNFIIFFSALFAVLQRESMDPGIVGLSVSYALQITQTLNWLVRMSSDVETNIVAVERIKEYQCDIAQEAEWEIKEKKPPMTWPETGAVTFDKYQTRYREGLELVLRDVTCKIQPAEKIGIVGRTGAGKSSLTLGLFRIIEAAGGSISIDGVKIGQLGLHDLRSRITIIPQDPVLFSGSLRFNLDPFEQYSDDIVWRALELAHLRSFVKSLPSGLQHEVSEGGENLSVGQRQLICLGRALLKHSKLLILDEASSAVDLETDDLIQQTIKSEFKDCTILTIAHRLNTIMDSTRIMVLDKGLIREFDTPESLLQNKESIFYGMAKDAGLA